MEAQKAQSWGREGKSWFTWEASWPPALQSLSSLLADKRPWLLLWPFCTQNLQDVTADHQAGFLPMTLTPPLYEAYPPGCSSHTPPQAGALQPKLLPCICLNVSSSLRPLLQWSLPSSVHCKLPYPLLFNCSVRNSDNKCKLVVALSFQWGLG